MRKIIISRKKSIIGCAGKVSFYTMEKFEEGMEITKDRCGFLGSLKNNSILESEIPENEILLIAAYDNLGFFMVTDYVAIPQGIEDVAISGKTKFNPSKGNPFLFEIIN